MRNFAGKSNPEKKVWGVLGKQETFYSPEQFQDKGRIIPLNANPLEAWDTTRSRYIRRPQMPPMPNDGQQAGVVSTSVAPTPTPTPSATPPAFLTPDLWYDSTNLGSIDYISSGGTDYVSAWRSIGTYQKVLTGTTTDTMPVWSGSSELPGSPLVVKFNKSATPALRDFLTQRFDSTVVPVSGLTIFQVITNPGYTFSSPAANQFTLQFALYSGNTVTGGFTPLPTFAPVLYQSTLNASPNNFNFSFISSGSVFSNLVSGVLTGAVINNKILYTQSLPYPTGFPTWTINNVSSAMTINISGSPLTNINSMTLGVGAPSSGGTVSTAANAGAEVAEIMIFGRPLTAGEQTQVQNYLKTKWRYDEWSVIPPSPTPTQTTTSTPTPSPTPTQTTTSTPTPTPSPTTPSFDSDYVAILNYATANSITLPDSNTQTLQNDLLVSLKTNNIWNKLDIFYVFAVSDENFANINWKNPGTFGAYKSGSISFTSNKGYVGSAINGFVGFSYDYVTHSVNYTATNASRFAYVFTGTTSTTTAIDTNNSGLNNMYLGNTVQHRIAQSSADLNSAFDMTGINSLKYIEKTSTNNVYLRNGNTTGTRTTTNNSLSASPALIIGRVAANWSDNGISVYGIGGSLSGLDSALNTAINTYITNV
jgi:hypothetical protein